jgi:hypothetical protein
MASSITHIDAGRRTAVQLTRKILGAAGLLFVLVSAATLRVHAADLPDTNAGGLDRGKLIGSVTLITLSANEINAQVEDQFPGLKELIGLAACGVQVDLIVYLTLGPKAESANASGVVLSPVDCDAASSARVVAYDRGTRFRRATTLSNPFDEETQLLIAILAAHGYTVVASDYLGYFASTLGYHPYLHAETAANTTVDALRAGGALLAQRGVNIALSPLFVAGYSQGGHAAMATHRALETTYAAGFPNFVASAPMSGPYDLETTFVNGVDTPTLFVSAYAAFTIVAYDQVYGGIYERPHNAFRGPYANFIEQYMPGPLELEELYAQRIVPTELDRLLNPKFIQDSLQENSPMRTALRANTLLAGWPMPTAAVPPRPMLLCGGESDPVVPFANTTAAATYFGPLYRPVIVKRAETDLGVPPPQSEAEVYYYHQRTLPPVCLLAARGFFGELLSH